jgi:hypothetical protein
MRRVLTRRIRYRYTPLLARPRLRTRVIHGMYCRGAHAVRFSKRRGLRGKGSSTSIFIVDVTVDFRGLQTSPLPMDTS